MREMTRNETRRKLKRKNRNQGKSVKSPEIRYVSPECTRGLWRLDSEENVLRLEWKNEDDHNIKHRHSFAQAFTPTLPTQITSILPKSKIGNGRHKNRFKKQTKECIRTRLILTILYTYYTRSQPIHSSHSFTQPKSTQYWLEIKVFSSCRIKLDIKARNRASRPDVK